MLDEGQPLRLVVSSPVAAASEAGSGGDGDPTLLPLYLDPNTKLFQLECFDRDPAFRDRVLGRDANPGERHRHRPARRKALPVHHEHRMAVALDLAEAEPNVASSAPVLWIDSRASEQPAASQRTAETGSGPHARASRPIRT
jgi:hypothetical protein